MQVVVLTLVVAILVAAGVYFGWQLARLLGYIVWAVWRSSRERHAMIRHEFATSTTDQLRSRLLADRYFDEGIRASPRVQDFLARLARGEEVALRREYSKRRLYGMLIDAERAAGRHGRPEVIETTVYERFEELARRGTNP